jgi:hypothetical protein
VIKFVINLQQVGLFSPGSPVSSTNKSDHHDITEILLKVALNTINLNPNLCLVVLRIDVTSLHSDILSCMQAKQSLFSVMLCA